MEYKKLKSLYYIDKDLWKETYNKRINSESAYKFNIGLEREFFVIITSEILDKVTEILKLDKTLFCIGNLLPKIALSKYTNLCIIEEIKGTNDIEGVKSTRQEIGKILNNIDKTKHKRLHGLIQKYLKLMSENKDKIETIQDIRDIYDEIVLDEVVQEDPENKPDGSIFRKGIVRIQNSSGKFIHTGVVSEEEIIIAMNKVLEIINDKDINPFIKIPVVHYLIGFIHPFYDGNGRLIRYITSSQLSEELESIVGLKIAYVLKSNLATYLKIFIDTNIDINRGDLTMFVEKFLDFILIALKETIEAMKEAYDKWRYYSGLLVNLNNDLNLNEKEDSIYNILIQNALFDTEGLDIITIREVCRFSDTYIRKVLKFGINNGFVIEKKVGRKFTYSLDLEEIDKKYSNTN